MTKKDAEEVVVAAAVVAVEAAVAVAVRRSKVFVV
jgi:hypothetical protein